MTMSGRSKLTTYFGGEEVMFLYDSVVNNMSCFIDYVTYKFN